MSAALSCFNEKGFASTTIDDVCARSGASVGSIYHHFGGKEGLAAALYVEGLADYHRGFLAVLDRQPDAEAGIKGVVRHHMQWVARHRDLTRFLLHRRETELRLATETRMRELNQVLFSRTDEWRRPHVEAGRLRPMPLELFYDILIGPAQAFSLNLTRFADARSATSIAEAEEVLADAAWSALAAR